MWQYNNTPDELYHYGVLGMKWGRRKAAKYQGKIDNAKSSKTTNKYQGKLNKVQGKIDKTNAKREFKKEFKKDYKDLRKITNRDNRTILVDEYGRDLAFKLDNRSRYISDLQKNKGRDYVDKLIKTETKWRRASYVGAGALLVSYIASIKSMNN